MSDEESLMIANEIASPHELRAEFFGDAMSVGVGGDSRTYTRVICLSGRWPGHEELQDISTRIGNRAGINRVVFELAR